MDPTKFDELTKALATPTSRRQALRRIGGILGGTALAGLFPGLALASNSACAKFCNAVFGDNTPVLGNYFSDAAVGKRLYHTCCSAAPSSICCTRNISGFCSSYNGADCPCDSSQCLTCDSSSGTCVGCPTGTCQSGQCVCVGLNANCTSASQCCPSSQGTVLCSVRDTSGGGACGPIPQNVCCIEGGGSCSSDCECCGVERCIGGICREPLI